MRKWEDKYNRLKNGEFDERIQELKEKIDNKTAKREEFKEYNSLLKGKENISKVENVIEYRDKMKGLVEDINKEVQLRKDVENANKEAIKIEAELVLIEKELENATNKLKDKSLKDEDRAKLEEKLNELKGNRDENNKKFSENQEVLKKGLDGNRRFKNYKLDELENLKLKTSARISKCNMVANSLVNGLSWDSIDLKLDNWDKDKKFTNKEKKLSEKDDKKPVKEPEKDKFEDVYSGKDMLTGEDILEKNLKAKREKEKTEFEKKHPVLSKIKNIFNKVKDRFARKEQQPELPKPDENKKTIDMEKAFKEEIKYVAEYGKDARKHQLSDNKDLNKKLEEMRKANRETEAKKFGADYAKKSDYRKQDGNER